MRSQRSIGPVRAIRMAAAVMSGLLLSASAASAFQPANDDCSTPTAVAGNGSFPFNNTQATTGPQGQGISNCSTVAGTVISIDNDLWYCWTAPCTGVATITTCNLTQLDTVIAVYDGCACPGPAPVVARCCNDDTNDPVCGLQSTVRCDVMCDHQYMIQIGTHPGTPPGQGSFAINCQGTDCTPPPPNPDTCCCARPRFTDPGYITFTGTVALSTYKPQPPGDNNVLSIFDLRHYQTNSPYAPPINGSGVYPVGGPDWPGYAPVFHPASATSAIMGNVFGLTLDDKGNIYLTQTSSYNGDGIGSLAGGNHGCVYQIDAVTGAGYQFIKLPNTNATGSSEDWPELGNIAWDCAHSQLFVSDLDDGRIYRVTVNANHTGTIQSNFDHATGTITTGPSASLPEAGDAAGFAPLGERVWAVQAHAGRLYYSVWNQDLGQAGVGPNTIRSIALTGAGEFTGASQLEITLPAIFGTTSAPVADISFNPAGFMIVGERCMSGDTSLGAHSARALEYKLVSGSWTLSGNNPFNVGGGSNSAGGVDYDWATNGRVWLSGDAIRLNAPDNVYGIQGTPATGGSNANSICIDDDANVIQQDKTEIGDVEISCPSCMSITDQKILCIPSTTGQTCYSYTFTVTNNSSTTAYYLLLAPQIGSPVTFTPNIITLNPPLAPGQSQVVNTTVCGVPCAGGAGCDVCFIAFLVDQSIQTCCSMEHCFTPPDCECGQITRQSIVCQGNGTYTYTFDVQNLSAGPVEHLFLFPPAGVSMTPNYFQFNPPLATNAIATNLVVNISGAIPGSTICFHISIHNHFMQECCSFDWCITLPSPCGTPVVTPPVIISNPVDQSVTAGLPVAFTVGVTGTPPFQYQWRRNGVDLVDNGRINGSNANTLTIYPTNTGDAGLYSVRVSSSCCGSVLSSDAVLEVFCGVDLSHNHVIDPVDIAIFINIWNQSLIDGTLAGDWDGNGRVEPADVGSFVSAWFAAINGC